MFVNVLSCNVLPRTTRSHLRPIGCTPALSVTQKAPLQLRYAACDAIYNIINKLYKKLTTGSNVCIVSVTI